MSAENTRCLVLWIEYAGTNFHGWQTQPGQRTVQSEIENALLRMCGEEVRVIGSGRTDAGVHAWGQVAHFHTRSRIEPYKVRIGLNTMMGRDVSIFDCREAVGGFHAQFDAVRKTYRYRILNRRSPSAIRSPYVWHVRKRLDTGAMRQAADILEGEHDFASFCREKGRPEDTVRRLERLSVERAGDEVVIEATAGGVPAPHGAEPGRRLGGGGPRGARGRLRAGGIGGQEQSAGGRQRAAPGAGACGRGLWREAAARSRSGTRRNRRLTIFRKIG